MKGRPPAGRQMRFHACLLTATAIRDLRHCCPGVESIFLSATDSGWGDPGSSKVSSTFKGSSLVTTERTK